MVSWLNKTLLKGGSAMSSSSFLHRGKYGINEGTAHGGARVGQLDPEEQKHQGLASVSLATQQLVEVLGVLLRGSIEHPVGVGYLNPDIASGSGAVDFNEDLQLPGANARGKLFGFRYIQGVHLWLLVNCQPRALRAVAAVHRRPCSPEF